MEKDMQKEKNTASPWCLLEIAAQILDAESFAKYCQEHPDEFAQAKAMLTKDNPTSDD